MVATSSEKNRNNGNIVRQPQQFQQSHDAQAGARADRSDQQPERDAAQMQALVRQAIQASMLSTEASDQNSPNFLTPIQRGSDKFLGFFESAAARKHRRVLEHNRDVAEETLEAMSLAGIIATDFVAESFDFEAGVEQLIRQYSSTAMVLGSAPVYVQRARQMFMQDVPGISQAGIASIRREIERR